MSDLSGPIIVEEDATHFLVGIHYNDRHLAREIDGRAWNGVKRRWTWEKNRKNYENLTKIFKEIAKRFDISDKNLTAENEEGKTDSNISDEGVAEGDWGFLPTTDNYLLFNQLLRIEEKLDGLLEHKENPVIKGEENQSGLGNKEIEGNKTKSDATAHLQAHEIIASITSDKAFNELILREGANQSPIQRLHNKIRDEIRSFREVEDEEIHEVLAARFQKQKRGSYIRRELGLVQLTWFAQEEKFYASGGTGEPDIYQMLHLFNSTRVAVEKYDQSSEEMIRMHAVTCLALGRIIWSRIRIRSTEEEEVMIELRKMGED
ncbi:hypothetical protein KBY65_10110 [Cyanobium sp. Alchichica 3B3-8F6]|uniref:hypothetical protein n=1 Tax=Cyanobium sp. Alchichica 3B3-8F6 TaxID=2823696 RepID=UPI0020CE6EC6|nr:hypothetical protein [Cyanobium sp. Alchichica 3B3-8F6]MCP9882827.1 hypothetical protein [Cyanobium sp. Alchichica 3B3-8F6]